MNVFMGASHMKCFIRYLMINIVACSFVSDCIACVTCAIPNLYIL